MSATDEVVVVSDSSPIFRFGAVGVTAFGRIFVKRSFWESLDDRRRDSFLVHERVHLRQQRDGGILWFVKYALMPKFRLAQEVEAYGEQARRDISAGEESSDVIRRYAACLSSQTYFGMRAGRRPRRHLRRTWRARKTVHAGGVQST